MATDQHVISAIARVISAFTLVMCGALVIVWTSFASAPSALADDCAANGNAGAVGNIGNSGANGSAGSCDPDRSDNGDPGNDSGSENVKNPPPPRPDPMEYAYAFACGNVNTSLLRSGQLIGDPCRTSVLACARFPGGQPLRMEYARLRGTTDPWVANGASCGPPPARPGVPAPPPIPTIAQIRQAFVDLPFAKPTVNIQPEGDVTLVNLPTYFQAQWPTGKLGPGDISNKVQLLSWSIEFRIDPASYNYDFGDGTFSGPTADLGGPYPEGKIRHTYTQPNSAASVKVDAELTGSYRVNGGANWIPLGDVADLQNEPVVTLQVREAKARLYGEQ